MADPRAASQCITATATTGTAPVALGTARATRSRATDEFGARWHHHARAGRGIPGVAKASRFPRSQNQAPAPNTNCGSAAARASLRASRATPASQRNAGLGTTLMTTATMGVLFAGGAGPAVQCRTASPPQRPAGKMHQRAVSEVSVRPAPQVDQAMTARMIRLRRRSARPSSSTARVRRCG
jgi:hypothetical protein